MAMTPSNMRKNTIQDIEMNNIVLSLTVNRETKILMKLMSFTFHILMKNQKMYSLMLLKMIHMVRMLILNHMVLPKQNTMTVRMLQNHIKKILMRPKSIVNQMV